LPVVAAAAIPVLVVAAALLVALLMPAAPEPPALSTTPAAPVPTAAPPTGAISLPAARPAPARAISTREWQQMVKNPDAHVGDSVIVFGHVTQFDAGTGTESFRANVDGVAHRQSYEYDINTMLGGDPAVLENLVQGDLFRAEVVVRGSYTYTTTMGGQTTVPLLWVTAVKATGSAG
jgi:hypothetical protein